MATVAPLAGLRVLDFGQVWAGPLLGQYISDFGAQVIQITSPARAAIQSSGASPDEGPVEVRYSTMSRNRLSLALDPTTEAGREVLHRLVAVSDLLFDNFSPRGARRVGIDYATLSAINPRIIVAELSAAGQDGPWADLLTYGPSLTALYGIKSLLGYADEDAIQEDVADLDPTAATYAMVAILAALRARERTGRGQYIDMAQGEAGLAAMATAVEEYVLSGRVMGPSGNRHPRMAPHGIYPAVGDDAWISISVDSEAAWHGLCEALGAAGLADDSRFRTLFRRLTNVRELDDAVGALTAKQDAWELTRKLQERGVASYPVLDTFATLADDQLSYRRGRYSVAAEGVAPEQVLNPTPWLMPVTPPTVYSANRGVGADNDRVLTEILGLTEEERARFQAGGAFGAA